MSTSPRLVVLATFSMKPMRLFFVGLIACSANTFAAQKTLLETPVKLNASAGVSNQFNQECEVGDLLARRIGPALNGVNKPRKEKRKDRRRDESDVAAKSEPAPAVLRVQVVQVAGAGPDEDPAAKEPKAITVTAEILDKGKVTRKTRITRSNSGGLLSRFKSTCSILDGAATAIAKELGNWVGDPSYQVPEASASQGKNRGKAIENTIPATTPSK